MLNKLGNFLPSSQVLFLSVGMTGAILELISPSIVIGQSMYPTLNVDKKCSADIVIIVCFRSPNDPNKIFIKRVLAVEDEWIPIEQNGFMVPYKIPKGYTWVEGDNTFHSCDSRTFGPIPLGLIQGKATHIIWPLHRISKIDTTVTTNRNLYHFDR